MKWILAIVAAIALLSSSVRADCQAGETVGPCLCIVDGNGDLSLQCTSVADGAEITAALQQIQVAELSSLDIRDSPDLTDMPEAAFDTTAVKTIRFYNTGLRSLPPNVFTGPTSESLTSLYVKHCSAFTQLNTSTVGVLTSLDSLYISSTAMTSLTGSLPNTPLQYIDLSFNKIQEISDDFFAAASELSVVLLNFNELTTDSFLGMTQSFDAPNQDLYLDLGWNSINYGLVGLSFEKAAPRELILSGNGITNLTQAGFEGLMNQMGQQYEEPYILLDNNPLLCECELSWILEHPYRSLLQAAMCDSGQLVENLDASDFADCP